MRSRLWPPFFTSIARSQKHGSEFYWGQPVTDPNTFPRVLPVRVLDPLQVIVAPSWAFSPIPCVLVTVFPPFRRTTVPGLAARTPCSTFAFRIVPVRVACDPL